MMKNPSGKTKNNEVLVKAGTKIKLSGNNNIIKTNGFFGRVMRKDGIEKFFTTGMIAEEKG